MPIDRDFLDMMPHTVTVTEVLGVDRRNVPVLGTTKTYRCRVSGKSVSLRRPTHEEFSSIVDVYIGFRVEASGKIVPIDETDVFREEYKLTLPDQPGWVDRTPVIFAVARWTDGNGIIQVKLQCGWMYHRQGQ